MDHCADMAAIGQTLARYARGVDRLDAELLRSAFWPEAYDDHGPFKGRRDDAVSWITQAMGGNYSMTNVSLGQSFFEFRGSRAAVETQYVIRGVLSVGQPDTFRILSGRYLDLLECRDGDWRILRRTVMYDSLGEAAAISLAIPCAATHRSRADPSYHIFAIADEPVAGSTARDPRS